MIIPQGKCDCCSPGDLNCACPNLIPRRLCFKFNNLCKTDTYSNICYPSPCPYSAIDGYQFNIEYSTDGANSGWFLDWVDPYWVDCGLGNFYCCPLRITGRFRCVCLNDGFCQVNNPSPPPDFYDPYPCGIFFDGLISGTWSVGFGTQCLGQEFQPNLFDNQCIGQNGPSGCLRASPPYWNCDPPDGYGFREVLVLGAGLQVTITAAPCWELEGGTTELVGGPTIVMSQPPELTTKTITTQSIYFEELNRELTGDILAIYLGMRSDGTALTVEEKDRQFFIKNYIKTGRDGIALAKDKNGKDIIIAAKKGCGCGGK